MGKLKLSVPKRNIAHSFCVKTHVPPGRRGEVEHTHTRPKYVIYYDSLSGLTLPEVLDACRAAIFGEVLAVRNTRQEVMAICKTTGALPITAARRNSELAGTKAALWCRCLYV